MNKISEFTPQEDKSILITNCVVTGTPSKTLSYTTTDGDEKEYCLIQVQYNKLVDEDTGEVVTRTVSASRSLDKTIPEKGAIVSLYCRIEEDERGKKPFFSISTGGVLSDDDEDILEDLEEFMPKAKVKAKGTVAPKSKGMKVNVDM